MQFCRSPFEFAAGGKLEAAPPHDRKKQLLGSLQIAGMRMTQQLVNRILEDLGSPLLAARQQERESAMPSPEKPIPQEDRSSGACYIASSKSVHKCLVQSNCLRDDGRFAEVAVEVSRD